MGLFNFFSEPPAQQPPPKFEEWFKRALSKYFTADTVDGKDSHELIMRTKDEYRINLEEISKSQSELAKVTEKDEELILIMPLLPAAFDYDRSLQGLVVVTSLRVFQFNHSILAQTYLSEIDSLQRVDLMDSKGGFFGLYLIPKSTHPVTSSRDKTYKKETEPALHVHPTIDYRDEDGYELVKNGAPVILISHHVLREEFLTAILDAYEKKVLISPSNINDGNPKNQPEKSLVSMLDNYVKIMLDNFVKQDGGDMIMPEQTQIDLDNEIVKVITSARKAGDNKTIAEAQSYLSKVSKSIPENQVYIVEGYSNRLFATFFKNHKRETMEDMIDNIVKANSPEYLIAISDEELVALYSELHEAALEAIKTDNFKALSDAHKHLYTDSTKEKLKYFEETRKEVENLITKALAGKLVLK